MGTEVVLDKGHLTFSDVTLSAMSAAITARPDQPHDLFAQVNGYLSSADGGRLFVKYSNGTIGYEWQNGGVFNGSQNVNGNFTTPTNVSSFQVGTAVVLDKGYLAFDDLTLTAHSHGAQEVVAEDLYRLTAEITGELAAAFGEGGRIMAFFTNDGQPWGQEVLWQNPANFSGTMSIQKNFTADYGADGLYILLETNLDAGHLAFGNFGLEYLNSGDVIQRSTYSVAGQAIAVKVAGDPELDNNGLFFLYSDHLGSANAMQHPNGSVTQTRYLPFGGYRGDSGGNPITDRGYTGHKHNDSLGLIYMNARYYSPNTNRMVSPDTIVPNLSNPQSFNRYSYVLNNPVNFTDPTGHKECDIMTLECSNPTATPTYAWELPSDETIQELAGVFDIPPELLGALLQIVQEVDYSSTGFLSNDHYEDAIFSLLAYGSHPAFLHPPLNLPISARLSEIMLLTSLVGKNPSPGLAQIQVRRAEEMEEWLFEINAGIARYEPMRQSLGRSESTADRLIRLYEPDTAAAYAAAHIRWLMEQEYGSSVTANDLTVDEMSVVAAQYNVGPRTEVPVTNYSGYTFYELAPAYIEEWQSRLRKH